MFVGNNHIMLNEATMRQALEEYFNNRIMEHANELKVITVFEATNVAGGARLFRVEVSPKHESK